MKAPGSIGYPAGPVKNINAAVAGPFTCRAYRSFCRPEHFQSVLDLHHSP